ncbi:MAG TPA: RsmD family RNA methyltransferase, partial [Thermoanaerobaculia bacterium]|nr:RsmD family RNA methyltransferase [Thermoanaerobaculia bacterium]
MTRSSAPRVLSGRWKGRPLKVPRGARPTSSRAREALFDILQDVIPGIRVLDLFAGSGAVGLEALSRGA